MSDTWGDSDNDFDEIILTNQVNTSSGGVFYSNPLDLSTCNQWHVDFDFGAWAGACLGGGAGLAGAEVLGDAGSDLLEALLPIDMRTSLPSAYGTSSRRNSAGGVGTKLAGSSSTPRRRLTRVRAPLRSA